MIAETLTREALEHVILFLKNSPWEQKYLLEVERLREKLDDPCVLAIAGRVKAGKSSLMNAYLEDDLAVVGVTAATATVNSFRYAAKEDTNKLIKCLYKDGREERVSREFLDRIQGHSREQLAEASRIRELQFFLNNPKLESMVLVDTPGTDAAVKEHEQNVAEYFQQTREADAILYVVGAVASQSNADFLKSFQQESDAAGTRPHNAIGVMARIDEDDAILAAREELAASCKTNLQGRLSTVVPISAGIWRVLCQHRKTGCLEALQKSLKENFEGNRLETLLKSHSTWTKDRKYEDCKLSVEEREKLRGSLPWRVFVVIARELKSRPLEEAVQILTEYSGFPQLDAVIETHFFSRGKLLRYFKVIARLLLLFETELAYGGLTEYQKTIAADKKRMVSFCDFIATHPQKLSAVAEDLRHFLHDHLRHDDAATWRNEVDTIIGQLQRVQGELEGINTKFTALILLSELAAEMAATKSGGGGLGLLIRLWKRGAETTQDDIASELEELRVLFGYYADRHPDPTTVMERQLYWGAMQGQFKNAKWQELAGLASLCYGHLLHANHCVSE